MLGAMGPRLRELRQRTGLSLDTIASETRIPLESLMRLEQSHGACLPGPILLWKAYLRAYVKAMHLRASEEAELLASITDALDRVRREQEAVAALEAAQRGWIGIYYRALVLAFLQGSELLRILDRVMSGTASLLWVYVRSLYELYERINSRLAAYGQRGQFCLHRNVRRCFAVLAWTQSQAERLMDAVRGVMFTVCMEAGMLRHRAIASLHTFVKAWHSETLAFLDRVDKTFGAIVVAPVKLLDLAKRHVRSALIGANAIKAVVGTAVPKMMRAGSEAWFYVAHELSELPFMAKSGCKMMAERIPLKTLARQVLAHIRSARAGLLTGPARLLEVLVNSSYLSKVSNGRLALAQPGSRMPLPQIIKPLVTEPAGSVAWRKSQNNVYQTQRCLMRSWNWVVPYVVALLLASGLAFILGNAPLFKTTILGYSGLTAERVVEFIGFGGALCLLWALGLRVAAHIPDVPILLSTVRRLMTPLMTLVVLSGFYKVILLIAEPFLDKTDRQIYDWSFVVAIILSAAWVTLAGFSGPHYTAMAEEVSTSGEALKENDNHCRCPECAGDVPQGMKFCGYCGAPVSP